MNEKKAQLVDKEGCMKCGACALNCPTKAIRVTPGVGRATYIISGWIHGKENANVAAMRVTAKKHVIPI